MKLQFKHQKFQADAAKAVCDVFAGQPYLTPTYMMDKGSGTYQIGMDEEKDFTGWGNQRIVPELNDGVILEHLNKIQRTYQIEPSHKLEGHYNLTIEMETGVGKTYTYIKTMYELNKRYGWSKYIVVVPSIAIREGVYKSFQITQEHFAEEYGKKIRFFIYNSAQLTEIDRFASDSSINVMIINSQAFNARGKDAALREGWDNPNVFQICTLKQSGSDVRKRQEVGRGLRLCVNQDGERMDSNALGNDVHNVNVLTVIASESYDSFAKGLQSELADAVADRPRAVTADLFMGKIVKDFRGNEQVIDSDTAHAIHYDMIVNGYIDRKGVLTDKYYADKANNEIKVAEEVQDCAVDVIAIVDSIYDSKVMQPENARSNNVELQVDLDKLALPEFKALWKRINGKSVYVVDFDTDELIQKAIVSLDAHLRVSRIFFKVETGRMDDIKSKDALLSGASFVYVKLPDGFFISTPVGHYNPDWAIAFYEGNVKHIYFVAETKGSMSSMQLRLIEESKIHCAREHFKAISDGNVVYDVIDSYQSLLDKVMK